MSKKESKKLVEQIRREQAKLCESTNEKEKLMDMLDDGIIDKSEYNKRVDLLESHQKFTESHIFNHDGIGPHGQGNGPGQGIAACKESGENGDILYFSIENDKNQWVVSIEKADNKWREKKVLSFSNQRLPKPDKWGQSYMGYLTSQDLLNWLTRDYEYVNEIDEEDLDDYIDSQEKLGDSNRLTGDFAELDIQTSEDSDNGLFTAVITPGNDKAALYLDINLKRSSKFSKCFTQDETDGVLTIKYDPKIAIVPLSYAAFQKEVERVALFDPDITESTSSLTEARKLKRKIPSEVDGIEAKVYWDNDTEEYVAQFFVNGKTDEAHDYFTDDFDDVVVTAKEELKVFVKNAEKAKEAKTEATVLAGEEGVHTVKVVSKTAEESVAVGDALSSAGLNPKTDGFTEFIDMSSDDAEDAVDKISSILKEKGIDVELYQIESAQKESTVKDFSIYPVKNAEGVTNYVRKIDDTHVYMTLDQSELEKEHPKANAYHVNQLKSLITNHAEMMEFIRGEREGLGESTVTESLVPKSFRETTGENNEFILTSLSVETIGSVTLTPSDLDEDPYIYNFVYYHGTGELEISDSFGLLDENSSEYLAISSHVSTLVSE